MIRTIAYCFEADVHCPACTRIAAQRMKVDHEAPYALGFSLIDENGLEADLRDKEGNELHPVFDTEEHDFTHCSDCNESLQ